MLQSHVVHGAVLELDELTLALIHFFYISLVYETREKQIKFYIETRFYSNLKCIVSI